MKLESGEIIQSRYRLLSLKGRGSFGEVWLAKDEQTDMDVAVKVYIALDDRGLEEFKAEYKNSYSLNHPNLLHAYYFDVVDRQPFLVMPYCPDSAESLVGNADEKTLLRFIRDVASGLEYLHARDIIHRDIKPDNILVNQEGNFVVTDFGVSSKMKSTLRRNSTRAMAGADVAGTIGYMAPELFSRNPDAVKATDIWALGVTVFEMASGEMPFFGQGGALLLRGADIPELRGEWSEGFLNIVDACLAKETWDRPTAARLVEMADSLLKGRPVAEHPVPPMKKTPEPEVQPVYHPVQEAPKKHSLLKYLLVAVIVAGSGGLLKVAITPRNTDKQEQKGSSQLALPSGSQLYHGEVTMASGKVLKIKRLELNYDTFKGKSYYSDTPLDLNFLLTQVGSLVQLEITETNPNMTKQSALGGKTTSIYNGTYNSDKTITGKGRNWHGEEFTFIFSPGKAPWADEETSPKLDSSRPAVESTKKTGETKSPSKSENSTQKTSTTTTPTTSSNTTQSSSGGRMISGMVYDSDHKPLTGISVKIKNGSSEMVTVNGRYSIMAHTGDYLVVSGAGYKTAEKYVPVSTSNLDFTLESTGSTQASNTKNSSPKISQTSSYMSVGQKIKLTVSGYDKQFAWESDNPAVAKVSSTGEVEAVGPGKTTIWAKIYSGYLRCEVTVYDTSTSVSKEKLTKKIAGYVRDQSGSPIVGATVMVKGTNNGTVVNAQGVYSITAKEGDVLVFSCLGFQDVTKTVGSESRIDVTMMEGKRKRR